MARDAITEFNRNRTKRPKCGAKRKRDGASCENLAMENGRCRIHGGLTPRGDNWHKHRWPDKDGPHAMKKLHKKQAQIERQEKAREKRLAAMTPEQRQAYDEWHRSRRPGPVAVRAEQRRSRQTAAEIQALMSRPDEVDPELARLAAKIEALKFEIAIERMFE